MRRPARSTGPGTKAEKTSSRISSRPPRNYEINARKKRFDLAGRRIDCSGVEVGEELWKLEHEELGLWVVLREDVKPDIKPTAAQLRDKRAKEKIAKAPEEGRVGTLVVMKSGKVKMVLGDDIVMNVSGACIRPVDFSKDVGLFLGRVEVDNLLDERGGHAGRDLLVSTVGARHRSATGRAVHRWRTDSRGQVEGQARDGDEDQDGAGSGQDGEGDCFELTSNVVLRIGSDTVLTEVSGGMFISSLI
jgi:hypothetical protein